MGRNAALVSEFAVKDLPLSRTLMNGYIYIYIYIYMPVAVYEGCGFVAFVYWFRLKQYL